MKRLLLVILFSCKVIPLLAQESIISNEKMNKLYIGIPNPVKAMVEGRDCRTLILRGDLMDVKSTGECSFDVWATKPGQLYLEIGVNENGEFKALGKRLFRIKYIPDPIARVAGKYGGLMTAETFRSADSIYAQLDNFDFDVTFEITSFNFSVSREGKELFTRKVNGNNFDSAMKQYLQNLVSGDKLIFTEVHAKGPDKTDRTLNDITLTLK